MVRQPTTKLLVSGHRFLMRRMQDALVRGDVRMLDDPLRAQSLSLTAGCVLALIAVAACAIVAFVQPRGVLGVAPIVVVRESGALYVRIDDVVHPVLNLASARLIAGSSAPPELVSKRAIDRAVRGPIVGIAGAPAVIAEPLPASESDWTVCDDATQTTVYVGALADRLASSQQILVTPDAESAATTYLLYHGRRARVDLRNPATVRGLKLDGVTPRPVSRVLLDTLPEAPEITAPTIAGAGEPSILTGFSVGTVVRLSRAGTAEYYVTLAAGVQRIGEVTADLIRFTQTRGRRDIVTVAPGVVGAVPIVADLPVATFPDHGGVSDRPVLCAQWGSTATQTNGAVLVADSLPTGRPVRLAQGDGAGPDVDSVVLPAGRSAYVRASGVTGNGADNGPRYLVTDSGVVFGIRDDEAAKRLGLTNPTTPAPWPVLARLPRGPELSVQAASIVRDSVGAPSSGR
jgi:type VII secretion protein EccB